VKFAAGLSLAFVIGMAAEAAEPVAPAPVAEKVPSAASSVAPAATPPPAKRLDLRVGKLRDVMTPKQMETMLGAPDWEKDAIVVEGKRELLPMKSEQPIPAGLPPLTLWWALRNPADSWRILVPDVNRKDPGPLTMEEKVPGPVFRWGP
jgi:hypothetical protein